MPTAILDASAITEIRTAAVTAVATRALAREDARVAGDPRRRRAGAARTCEALLPVRDVRRTSASTRRPRRTRRRCRRAPGTRAELSVAPSAEHAVRGADVVVVATSAREPVLERDWLADRRPRQRGRRQLPERRARSTSRPSPPRAVLRQPRVAAQRGRRVPARDRARARSPARTTSAPSSARCWRALQPGRARRQRADAVSLARPRGRGPRRGRARGRERPQPRASGPRSSCDRAGGDRGGARADRRRGGPHAAGAAARRERPGRDLPQAGERCSRSTRSRSAARPTRSCCAPEPSAPRAWSPPAPATWRRASRGRRASSGVPATIAVPEHAPAGQARRDRAAGRAGPQAPLRRLVERDRHQPRRRRRRACSCTRSRTRA